MFLVSKLSCSANYVKPRVADDIDNNDFDGREYEWQFIDKQSSKIRKSIRSIFMSIDIEFIHLKDELAEQFILSHQELTKFKRIKTVNVEILPKSEQAYMTGTSPRKVANSFEYFLYRKAEQLFHSNLLTVKESVNNRSLTSDLIPKKEWLHKNKIIENTGFDKLLTPNNHTLTEKHQQLEQKLKEVSEHIFSGNNQYVEFLPGKNELKWSIPNSRWQQPIDNPLYNQIQHMGIVKQMSLVDQKTGYLSAFAHISANKEKNCDSSSDCSCCSEEKSQRIDA